MSKATIADIGARLAAAGGMAPQPAPTPTPDLLGDQPITPKARTRRPAYRQENVHVGVWLPAQFGKNLLIVRGKRGGITLRALIAEQLNELFRVEGLPVIDLE